MKRKNSRKPDFDHPSPLLVLEDKIKYLTGGRYYYGKDIDGLNLKGKENVLDFGCGGGTASLCLLKLLNKNGHLLGVDNSGYWIKIARKRLQGYANAECRPGDIREMNLPLKSFDLIVIFHVLHDIAPESRQTTLITLAGLLKKDGRLFLREPTRTSHGMPVREIRTLLTIAGLKETSCIETKADYRGIAAPEI